jgi:hypothetical protein
VFSIRWLMIAVFILCAVGEAHAQENVIGLFSDSRGCPCEITDVTSGLITVAVLHVGSPGAVASQFSAPKPACFNVSWLSDTKVFPLTIGTSQDGVAVGYEQCMTGTFQILTINYFGSGTTPECCYYPVVPDPYVASGEVEVVDCYNQLLYRYGWAEYINSTPACQCYAGHEYCYPVAVEAVTWGKIKSLYE